MTLEEIDLMKKFARERVATYDAIDRKQDRGLDVILAALDCGLKNPETGALFDAYVMLEDHINGRRGAG